MAIPQLVNPDLIESKETPTESFQNSDQVAWKLVEVFVAADSNLYVLFNFIILLFYLHWLDFQYYEE